MGFNLFIVLIAAIAGFCVGYVWYAPYAFGRIWMHLRGKELQSLTTVHYPLKEMLLAFLAACMSAFVLEALIIYTNQITIIGAMQLAFWAWLGFRFTALLDLVLWESRSWPLFFLQTAQHLVSMLVMAIVLAL